jgi:hypothetical protein
VADKQKVRIVEAFLAGQAESLSMSAISAPDDDLGDPMSLSTPKPKWNRSRKKSILVDTSDCIGMDMSGVESPLGLSAMEPRFCDPTGINSSGASEGAVKKEGAQPGLSKSADSVDDLDNSALQQVGTMYLKFKR